MPRFFFHLVSPADYSHDDTGTEFPSFYDAYLDAHSAAAEISSDLLRQNGDPNRYRFVIADNEGRTLADLPFIETERETEPEQRALLAQVALRIENSRKLRKELKDEFDKTRTALAETRALLARSLVTRI